MAIDFTIETAIDRRIEDVFAFVTHPERVRDWQPLVVSVEVLDGLPLRDGARLREVRRVRGKQLAQTVRVSAFEPPHRFGLEIVEGPLPVDADLSFAETPQGGTLVRARAHGRAPGALRLVEPLLSAFLRRDMRRQYQRLKSVLETSS